jgi:hypothetical protein
MAGQVSNYLIKNSVVKHNKIINLEDTNGVFQKEQSQTRNCERYS